MTLFSYKVINWYFKFSITYSERKKSPRKQRNMFHNIFIHLKQYEDLHIYYYLSPVDITEHISQVLIVIVYITRFTYKDKLAAIIILWYQTPEANHIAYVLKHTKRFICDKMNGGMRLDYNRLQMVHNNTHVAMQHRCRSAVTQLERYQTKHYSRLSDS